LTDARLETIEITVDDVIQAINSTPLNKAPGPDTISPFMIKQVNGSIAPILASVFNRSLRESIFPAVWKRSLVVPIFKKGSKTEPINYRPISLTSIFSKIYEKSVLKYILDYLLTNNLIYHLTY